MFFKYHFLTILLYIHQVFPLDEDYYWREYTGSVPKDAVVAGKDINGRNVYIGQAYVKNQGLIVAQINPEIKEVYAPIHGIKKIESSIKILCGPQEAFYWIPANASDLHLTLIDKHAVIGGHEDGGGHLNVGRISHEGDIRIGKVNSFSPGNAHFYFNDKGSEKRLSSYEILLYNNNNIIDVRTTS